MKDSLAPSTWRADPERERREILFVGDVHLGRRPSGLDEILGDHGLRPRALSPAVALDRVTEHACAHPPRAVVFAGDLVDQEDDCFEAYGDLERNVRALRERGIAVLAVAGNHDAKVLPRLIRRVEGVELLGADATWELRALEDDGPPVDLLAWSFKTSHHSDSPLDAPGLDEALGARRPDARVLGVLHGDLDAGSSRYAPVSRRRLEDLSLDACFLGHVHQPCALSEMERPLGYLGSLVGLKPTEAGPRGPWRVEVPATGPIRPRQVALSPIRWERFELPLEEEHAADEDRLHAHLEAWLRERLEADESLRHEHLQAVVVRVELTGRLAHRAAVRRFVAEHAPKDTVFRALDRPVIVQRLYDHTRAAVDLEVLARESSPLGHVAAQLLELQAGGAEALVRRAGEGLEGLGNWRLDEDDLLELPPAREVLEQSAWRLLDVLLAQREELSA